MSYHSTTHLDIITQFVASLTALVGITTGVHFDYAETPTRKAFLPTPTPSHTIQVAPPSPKKVTGNQAPATAGVSGVWDRLAQCEAGGRWNANTGNGYYGGLQFNLGTWQANGGTGNPANASREEQIRVATNLHAKRGFAPWPGCKRKLGL